jgi:hypothetical protein
MKIANALVELGYTEFVVYNESIDEIVWVVEPDKKPTKKEIEDMVAVIDDILLQRKQDQNNLKISGYKKLGLSDDEINAIIGSV